MRFYLGTHVPSWLASVSVPLFVSHRRLGRLKRLPAARTGWALDSGGFSELSLYGAWRTSPAAYATAILRYRDEIGRIDWAAPQDWMCEPFITAKTGRPVAYHQRATVASVVELRGRVGSIVIPVLQGWQLGDYVTCAEMYRDAGIDLAAEPLVGVGSVCRRQGSTTIAGIIGELASYGFSLHGFGVKVKGVGLYAGQLASADSMAWSYSARRHVALAGCSHRSCANCPRWALRWRDRVIRRAATQQLTLADAWRSR